MPRLLAPRAESTGMVLSDPGDEGGAAGGKRRGWCGPCRVEMSVGHMERARGQPARVAWSSGGHQGSTHTFTILKKVGIESGWDSAWL